MTREQKQHLASALGGSTICRGDRIVPTAYSWRKDNYYLRMHWRLRVIASVLRHERPKSVLDVGCGVAALRQLLGPGIAYYAFDGLWDGMIDPDPNVVRWTYEPGASLPFERVTFGALVCSGFLEYVDDHISLFEALHERLIDAGLLIASVLNPHRPALWLRRAGFPIGYLHPAWRNLVSLSQVDAELTAAGFVVECGMPIARWFTRNRNADSVVARGLALGRPSTRFLERCLAAQYLFVARKS